MIFHTCVGHPLAALASRLGLSKLAQKVHFFTLSSRAKKLVGGETIYDESKELFWVDFFFLPVSSFLWNLYLDRLAAWFFCLGPWRTAKEHKTCGYYPYQSGGVKRKTQEMSSYDIVSKLRDMNREKIPIPFWITSEAKSLFSDGYYFYEIIIPEMDSLGSEFHAKIQKWLEDYYGEN